MAHSTVDPTDYSYLSPSRKDYHRFNHGEFEITVLSDGFISIPDTILVPLDATEDRTDTLARLDSGDGVVRPKANIPLIRKGDDLIVVDIGGGQKYQPTDGQLELHLGRAGIDPRSVTQVVFTHAHPDHIWATLREDGSLLFPNATYSVGAAEWDFWMDPEFLTNMPAGLHDFAIGSRRDLSAVKDRAVMLRPGQEVVSGLRAIATPGHTPGHLSFELAGADGLIIAADVANNEIVSFEHPDWKFGYDTDPERGIETRKRFLDRVATDRTKLLGFHWPYPGIGYAEKQSAGFKFCPQT